jgi:uncharacterized alkaline shock family protein YloU
MHFRLSELAQQMKGVVLMLKRLLYRVFARFIRENLRIGVSIEDNGNPNYRTLYVQLKIGNEVVAADYTKLDIKV